MPALGAGDSGFESLHPDMNFETPKIPNIDLVKEKTYSKFKGFVDFLREQGVVGLAIGFIVGGAVSKIVSSFVTDVINPLIGVVFGNSGNLAQAALVINGSSIKWGSFVTSVIDFIIVAAVVYFGFKALRIERLDKKKC